MHATELPLAAALFALCAGLFACAFAVRPASATAPAVRRRSGMRLRAVVDRWHAIWAAASRDAAFARGRSNRRLALGGCAAGALLGFALLGPAGAVLGVFCGPFAVRVILKTRRERFAVRVDDCAAEFALALAAALAGGNSVRGAMLAAATATPEPLSQELERVSVDLALGQNLEDSLAALRGRTASPRVDAIAGAIELHRNSGGDLVQLMRELASAFRARDVARRDAHAATAQARFTAIVVAAIPLTLGVVAELVKPGAVSGAFAFAPTALLMTCALGLLACGGVLCARIGRVG